MQKYVVITQENKTSVQKVNVKTYPELTPAERELIEGMLGDASITLVRTKNFPFISISRFDWD